MDKKSRLFGIDLLRGLAIYAVILVHIDEGISITSKAWLEIAQFAGFAVPFFLATSFYLAIGKLYRSTHPYPLASRLNRLLIPYVLWSIIYLLYKSLKYFVDNDFELIASLIKDPISLIFLGGSAFHLYFLPLLMVGTLCVKVSEHLIQKQIGLKSTATFLVVSLLAYELLLASGNSFQMASGTAFVPLLSWVLPDQADNFLLRVVCVAVAWITRCLPYILLSMFICHPSLNIFRVKIEQFTIPLALSFLFVNSFGVQFPFQATYEISRGFLALLLAIAVSPYLRPSSWLSSIGNCSFGIYLIHLVFIEMFYIVDRRVGLQLLSQPNAPILLSTALVVFLISWLSISLLLRWKTLSKILFGI